MPSLAEELRTFCPIHEYERKACDWECLPARQAYRKANSALHSYWYDWRREGKTSWRARVCTGCRHVFVPQNYRQEYCTLVCRNHFRTIRERAQRQLARIGMPVILTKTGLKQVA